MTTVTSDQADPIGGLVAQDQMYPHGNAPQSPAADPAYSGGQPASPAPSSTQTAALSPSTGASSKQLYETAYGYLLQQD